MLFEKKKPIERIEEIAKVIGKHLNPSQIDSIIKWCSFDNMRNNKATSYNWLVDQGYTNESYKFFRKGQIGDWKNHFSAAKLNEFDRVINDHLQTKHNFSYE